jgi:hypothetical protein
MTESSLSPRWCNPPWLKALLGRGSLVTAVLGLGLALVVAPLAGQTGTVNGRVTVTGTGDPIVGAQVTLVGTNIGTETDANGEFILLNVPVGRQQIRVAQIGYRVGLLELNVQSGSITAETIQLTRTVLRLDEVVVTGTAGQARRREVGNSIAQLQVAENIDPPASMDMLLQGRAAGVNVNLAWHGECQPEQRSHYLHRRHPDAE